MLSLLRSARLLTPTLPHSVGSAIRCMSTPSIPRPPDLRALETPEDNEKARGWLEQFKTREIPKELVEMSFSRSSGPGGQNVNKVNTKATLRVSLYEKWIPLWARDTLKKSSNYVASSDTLLVTSTVHRSQAQNVAECLSKLHALILSASSAALVNEASPEQKKRVEQLEKAEKARRRQMKEKRSSVKRGRSAGKGGAWD